MYSMNRVFPVPIRPLRRTEIFDSYAAPKMPTSSPDGKLGGLFPDSVVFNLNPASSALPEGKLFSKTAVFMAAFKSINSLILKA